MTTCLDIARAALEAGQISGQEHFFRCNQHDDEHPSLMVNATKNNWLCGPCAASGNWWQLAAFVGGHDPEDKGSVRAWLKANGLTNGSNSGLNGTGRKIVATYPYHDEDGELLFEVVRFEPKEFRQRRPDVNGGWVWNLRGVQLVPYALPRWKGSPYVLIVEGEKHADFLREWQLPATSAPMGAGKWREEFNQWFAGKKVAILPDNDEPGRRHARIVALSLLPVAGLVKIVALPDLPHKGDILDYAAAGGSRERLMEIIRETPAVSPACLEEPETTEASGPVPVVTRLSDVEPEEIQWLWQDRFARGKQALIIGDPGLGKSTVTLDMASRISTGSPWPDGSPCRKGSVLLLTAEDGLADTVRRRVDILGGDPKRIHVLEAIQQDDDERPFSLVADIPHLKTAIDTIGDVDLVVIDPLSAYLGSKDSYKDPEIRSVLGPLASLADKTRVAVIGIAHLGKSDQRKALYRALGSVAFVAAARTVFAVAKDEENPRGRLVVSIKNNLTADPPALAFRILESGELTWDGVVDGIDADSVLSSAVKAEDRCERQGAEEFLRELLEDGQVATKEVMKAARENGIAEKTLRRAKTRLGVEACRLGGTAEGGRWYWSLPAASKMARDTAKVATIGDVAILGQASDRTPVSSTTSAKMATPRDMAILGRLDGDLRDGTWEADL